MASFFKKLASLFETSKSEELLEKIKESEARFRMSFERAPSGIVHISVDDDRWLRVNDKYCEMMGYTREELDRLTYNEITHPDDLPADIANRKKLLSGEIKSFDIEKRYIKKDGSIIWVMLTCSLAHEESTGLTYYISMLNDITLQKSAQEALKESQRLLWESQVKLLEAQKMAHMGSFTYDLETKELNWTEELYNIYGLDPFDSTLTSDKVFEFIHPEDREHVLTHYYKAIENNGRLELEYRIITCDKKTKYLYYIGHGLVEPGGKSTRRFGTVMDITERKQIQLKLENTLKELKEKESHLSEAQKLAHIGSFTVDYENGGKVEWSEEMFRIYERNIDEGHPTIKEAYAMIHPDDLGNVAKVVQTGKEEKRKMEVDYRIVTAANRIKYLHSIFNPVFDSSGNLINLFGTSLDITEGMKQQDLINETLMKLEHSNQELQQFAYVASHDLQEPLRMVTSYMTLLEKKYKYKLDSKGREFIQFAIDGSRRMANLIKDLLTYSRITSQAKEFSEVDLNNTLEDVMHDLQVLIREKNAVLTAPKLPTIIADPTQMHQLMQNLIGNAIKFHADKTPEVMVKVKEIFNGWLISVRDNGIGIDSKDYERIFQVFQRLHERDKYEGTGIGLAVCKKIVEHHGGRIWVESEKGKGTTFYFTIAKEKRLIPQT